MPFYDAQLLNQSFPEGRPRTPGPRFSRRSLRHRTKKNIPLAALQRSSLTSSTTSTHAAAMLPSRGIVRSLPSGAFQRQLASQSVRQASNSLPQLLLASTPSTRLADSGVDLKDYSPTTRRWPPIRNCPEEPSRCSDGWLAGRCERRCGARCAGWC